MDKIAVKAFIIKNGKILILRTSREEDFPGIWEIPGGKIDNGENLEEGLKREVKEETGLEIEVLFPLTVKHFRHPRGFVVHLLTFLCKYASGKVRLSDEHEDLKWVTLQELENMLSRFYHSDITVLRAWFLRTRNGPAGI